MIQANPDYKLQFEQITRLGRAFGVTLILATQRPSGAVTDQMKANMKFRMCLRVETTDDSREMLGRNDAATLPGIPGRGYLQVGGGPVSEFQAAYSGASYDIGRPDPAYSADEILEVFQTLNARGTTLILVTHDREVGAAAQRIVYILDGQIHESVG